MSFEKLVSENDLASLAKQYRLAAKITKSEVARQLGVVKGTIHQAEECPEVSLAKVRIRMIEKFSPFKVSGRFYRLEKK
jgi:DNA-binding XRE family transcriptional regulator